MKSQVLNSDNLISMFSFFSCKWAATEMVYTKSQTVVVILLMKPLATLKRSTGIALQFVLHKRQKKCKVMSYCEAVNVIFEGAIHNVIPELGCNIIRFL